MNQVKYPELRVELAEHLRALSDHGYQRRVWVGGCGEGGIKHDELDYAVHFLYDDTQLAEDPYSAVGLILRSASEAECIQKLVATLEVIFQAHGTKLSDAEYISLPEWTSVLQAAQAAREVIQ